MLVRPFSSRLLVVVAPLLLAAASCASSNVVRVPNDDSRSAFHEVQKLDCSVYDERARSLSVGLNFSLLWGGVSAGPAVTRSEAVGMKWDKSVHAIIAQYKEVCSRYNSGALTQAGYDTRIAEIDQLYAEASGIRQNADVVIRSHSQQAFAELDRQSAAAPVAAAGGADAEQVVQAVDVLMAKLGGP